MSEVPPRDIEADLSVVIPTLRRPERLRNVVASILRCDPLPSEVIVVDGDEQGSAEPVVEGFAGAPIPILHVASPRGSSHQRNAGLRRVRGPVTCFFDDDVTLDPALFGHVVDLFDGADVVGATGRVIEDETRRFVGKHSGSRRFLPGGGHEGSFTRYGYPRRLVHVDEPRDVEFMEGCCMAVRTSLARELLFDENLEGYALAEDEDFSYRVSRYGRIKYEPKVIVHHAKEGFNSQDQRTFNHRVVVNRAYLFGKNFEQTPLARLQFGMFVGLLVIHRIVNREWAGVGGLADGVVDALRTPLRPVERRHDEPRVAFVSSHAKRGGAEMYLDRLLDCLPRASIDGVVYLEAGPAASARRYPVGVIETGPRWPDLLRSARRLRRMLRARRAEVVHANGIKAAIVSVLATVSSGVPVVWVKHDFSFDGAITTIVAARCAHIVGVSRAVVAALPRWALRKVTVVPNAIPPVVVDADEGRRRLIDALAGAEDDVVIGLPGRLHPIKGHVDVLEALTPLLHERPDLRLVLIGGEDPAVSGFADLLRRRALKAGIAEQVSFLGHRLDAVSLMSGLDIGVIASTAGGRRRVEGSSLVGLELLAVGTPIVAYAEGGIPEVVGGCAVLVPPGDVPALSEAIRRLLNDPERRAAMSSCGRERSGHWTLEDVARSMQDLYREVADRCPAER